jgi:ribonuclease D
VKGSASSGPGAARSDRPSTSRSPARQQAPRREVPPRGVPPREAIELLEPFPGIDPERIVVVATEADVAKAHAALMTHTHVGFDTESKPTFARGERSDGPHVLQFATLDRAYVFQLHVPRAAEAVAALLESESLTKVGFGLDGDKTQIRAKLQIEPRSLLDLDTLFRDRGYRKSVGLKVAVALVFNQCFSKSKRIGTSNWSHRQLTDRQLLYAANDAYAAMQVYAAIVGWRG